VPVERSRIDDRGPGTPALIEGGVHDRGFFNIGVTPTSFDLGAGGFDDYGNPLSDARMFIAEQLGPVVDPTGINPCVNSPLIEPGGTPPYPCTDGVVNAGFDWASDRQLEGSAGLGRCLLSTRLNAPGPHDFPDERA
jgi:hypothetical protein